MRSLLTSLILTAAAVLTPPAAALSYTVYTAEGKNTSELQQLVHKLLPPATEGASECRFLELKTACNDVSQAEIQAEAIEAGVTHLPCLVLADDMGPYATLLLHGLTRQSIEQAATQAAAPDRESKTEQRRFDSQLYLLFARCAMEEPTAETLDELVQESRLLLSHELCPKEMQQLIGLRCLYPLLMKQYAIGHTGAHTPATEAKLLEAIAALEAARDLDPESATGKRAHDERHRLRMARREARKYE